MIGAIELRSFKRFERLTLEFGPLTVLTGLNGSGKSSVVQALLLAHQSSLDATGGYVPLVGEPGLDLGQGSDVLNVNAGSTLFEVVIVDNGSARWAFDAASAEDEAAPYLRIEERPSQAPEPFGRTGASFSYLSAERLGPRTSHPAASSHPDEAVVGEDGRYVAHALAIAGRREVPEPRRHDSTSVLTLNRQAEAWISSILGETQLDAALVPRTSLATLRIRNPGRMADWMLPTNTGFGISYSLPVVVAGLLAPEGGLLIVDSPEAHLHPAAQSAMGFFLASVAASGVQVIVETHSEHVLNGVRRHVADSTKRLAPEAVRIAFFGEAAEPEQMTIDSSGAVDHWPDGFFDQLDADLAALTRIRFSPDK